MFSKLTFIFHTVFSKLTLTLDNKTLFFNISLLLNICVISSDPREVLYLFTYAVIYLLVYGFVLVINEWVY